MFKILCSILMLLLFCAYTGALLILSGKNIFAFFTSEEKFFTSQKLFRFCHFLLTFMLFCLVAVGTLSALITFLFHHDDTLFLKKEISENVWLYETECLMNFMADDEYSYYIAEEIKGDPMPVLQKRKPFLIGTSKTANFSLEKETDIGKDRHLLFQYSGEIFRFENRQSITGNHSLWIDLQSTGVDPRNS